MKSKFYILLCLLIVSPFIQAQNLVRNGGFESGDVTQFDCVTRDDLTVLDNLAHWKPAFEKPNKCRDGKAHLKCGTGDWFDFVKCFDQNGMAIYTHSEHAAPSGTTGGKFVGMISDKHNDGYFEGFRIQLTESLKPDHLYELRLRMAIDSMQMLRFSQDKRKDTKLRVGFTEWGEKWDDGSNEQWFDFTDVFLLPPTAIGWHEKVFKFRVPEDGVNGIKYSDLKNLVIHASLDNNSLSYAFVDDVSLYYVDPCNSICTDSSAHKKIEFGEISRVNWVCNRVRRDGSCADLWGGSYKLAVHNATDVKLEIYDRWGGKFYEHHQWDPNVLRFDGLDHFGVEWAGSAQDGSRIGDRATFSDFLFKVRAENCSHWKEESFMVNFVHLDSLFRHIPDYQNDQIDTLKDCCPDHLIIDNHQYVTDSREAADNYIHAGIKAQVVVTSGTKLEYNAGNEIILGNNFSVASGGEFEAHLRSCALVQGKLGKGNTNSWVLGGRESMPMALPQTGLPSRTAVIIVSPNPSEGLFTVSHRTKKRFVVEVYNLNNQLILQKESYDSMVDIDLSPYDRGMYYIKSDNDVEKIIKH